MNNDRELLEQAAKAAGIETLEKVIETVKNIDETHATLLSERTTTLELKALAGASLQKCGVRTSELMEKCNSLDTFQSWKMLPKLCESPEKNYMANLPTMEHEMTTEFTRNFWSKMQHWRLMKMIEHWKAAIYWWK